MTREPKKLMYCIDSPNCEVYKSLINLLTEIASKSKNPDVSSIDASNTISGVVIRCLQPNKHEKREEHSCLALERLFYYPQKEISNFGDYDHGKEKRKKFRKLMLINRGEDYEFGCEKINKLNNKNK